MNRKKRIEIDLHTIIERGNKEYGLEDAEENYIVPQTLLQEIATELRKADLQDLADKVMMCETVGDLNDTLEEVFDECNKKRIWCGMPNF